MKQKFFDLTNSDDKIIIYSSENKNIVSVLEKIDEKLVIITGSKKSGKTTLAKKFSSIHKAKLIFNNEDLLFNPNQSIYFIDKNLIEIDPELLFHFIQNIIAHNYCLYIFSEENNSKISTGLKDLDSRLSLFTKMTIEEPEVELMKILLKKHLDSKSIKINDSIIKELPYVIDRTYESVYECSNDINRLLYDNNHNINLRLIKEFYNAI